MGENESYLFMVVDPWDRYSNETERADLDIHDYEVNNPLVSIVFF